MIFSWIKYGNNCCLQRIVRSPSKIVNFVEKKIVGPYICYKNYISLEKGGKFIREKLIKANRNSFSSSSSSSSSSGKQLANLGCRFHSMIKNVGLNFLKFSATNATSISGISGKEDNLVKFAELFEDFLPVMSVPFWLNGSLFRNSIISGFSWNVP